MGGGFVATAWTLCGGKRGHQQMSSTTTEDEYVGGYCFSRLMHHKDHKD